MLTHQSHALPPASLALTPSERELHERMLAAKDAVISEKDARLADKDATIAGQANHLADLQKENVALRSLLARKTILARFLDAAQFVLSTSFAVVIQTWIQSPVDWIHKFWLVNTSATNFLGSIVIIYVALFVGIIWAFRKAVRNLRRIRAERGLYAYCRQLIVYGAAGTVGGTIARSPLWIAFGLLLAGYAFFRWKKEALAGERLFDFGTPAP